jgi:uncharacterized protein YjbI with pentapeptide repeats
MRTTTRSLLTMAGLILIGAVVTIPVVLVAVVVYGYVSGRWEWGGTEFDGASLWDWLELLIVPVMIAVVGFLINAAQRVRDERAQRQREDELWQAQKERDQSLEEARVTENALSEYFNDMDSLIREGLSEAPSGTPLVTAAQVGTLRVLARAASYRKGEVVQFLHTARLINKDDPIFTLKGADLSNITLRDSALRSADLRGVNLRFSDLSSADLRGVILLDADLRNTYLRDSDLRDADLRNADLRDADVSRANLQGVKGITSKELERQVRFLNGTVMPDGREHD